MPSDTTPARGRIVVLAGATGLVGAALLKGLLEDPGVAAVHALGRRAPGLAHPKLVAHQVDFTALPALPAADEAYLALGTTIKQAGSQAAFRAVDFDANLAVAHAAVAAGVQRMGLVSAMGASSGSRIFYNRVKGELEDALAALHLHGLVIARPSMLLGDRAALGQPVRPGEQAFESASRVLGGLIPRNFRAIRADKVAAALLARVPVAQGPELLLSGMMQQMAVGTTR